MPELPEVETTVRGLEKVLLRQRIARVETRRGDLGRPFPDDLGQRLTGATVIGFEGGSHCFDGHGDRLRDLGVEHIAESFNEVRELIGLD